MATYPVKHNETGEMKDVVMSVHEWDQWKEDNEHLQNNRSVLDSRQSR